MKNFLSSFFLFLSLPFLGFSQIEEIILRWDPGVCDPGCTQIIKEYLEKMNGVQSVSVSQPLGQATIKWKKNVLFSFSNLNTAFRSAGIAVRQFWFRVQGKIQVTTAPMTGKKQITLISEGDNTPFILLGPISVQPNRYTIPYSLENYPLTPALEQQFLEAMQKQEIVTVQGPLFQPERYVTTLYLIVENATNQKQEQPGIKQPEVK